MLMRFTGEQLARIQAIERAGRLTAEAVLTDARQADSPLHDLFEWDNERAADEYRLQQAREVVRSVEYRIERRNISINVPRYIPDPSVAGNRPGYMSLQTVQEDDALAVMAVVAELNRSLGYLKRAAGIASALDRVPELAGIVVAVTRLRDDLRNGQAEIEASAAVSTETVAA